jgi:uncharacterized C2H2 Zn-finger protein
VKEDATAMAKTFLASLKQIASAKRSLRDKTKHLAEAERRVVEEVRRLLSGLGYTLVATDGQGAAAARVPTRSSPRSRTRKALPKTLKCPKCDRRFSLQMHVARHMNAKHRATKRTVKKARKGISKRTK